MHCLSFNLRTDARFKGARRRQINTQAKQLFQAEFQAHELNETRRLIKLDQNVYIAVRSEFITRRRTKNAQ